MGKLAYQLFFAQDPVPQEALRLLRHHDNSDHAYLILEAQRLLDRAGFVVLRYPEPLDFGQLGRDHPDLQTTYAERTLYSEVERGT